MTMTMLLSALVVDFTQSSRKLNKENRTLGGGCLNGKDHANIHSHDPDPTQGRMWVKGNKNQFK